jgi:hypothetical protein
MLAASPRSTAASRHRGSTSKPTTPRGTAEHGPGDAALGVADLGVVGEVAGEADAGLGHGPAPSWCLAGRSALPLEPGDGGHRGMPTDHQGQATEPTKSAMHELAGCGRLRCRVGWWGACGWGSGMPGAVRPDPSTLGVAGERGSRREDCSRPFQAACSGLRGGCLIQREVHGGGVVAALGPGPLSALGVNGLSSSDLAEQLVRPALL